MSASVARCKLVRSVILFRVLCTANVICKGKSSPSVSVAELRCML